MNQNQSTNRKSYTLVPPINQVPEMFTTCPRCGGEIEIMSDEDETRCLFCDFKLYDRETTSH